jgi:hypothetical protein
MRHPSGAQIAADALVSAAKDVAQFATADQLDR